MLVRPIDVRIDTRFGDLHLLNATGGIPPYSDMDHMTIVIDDLPIQVASLAALRAMKREAARPKDLVDLAELDAIHGSED